MATACCFLFLFLLLSHFVTDRFVTVNAQNIATTTPIPPLQWIKLSDLLQGSTPPPPLTDAAVGYDETSRSLIVFGGLSESGLPQSQTYLLNLQTMSWSTPSPPANLQRTPPPRSAALSGMDFAASNRHGFVVIGGQGSNGEALSDIWEYDFNNQFWSQIQLSAEGPSARWGASGGIDIRTPADQDPVLPGPNNTFYLAGGFDGKTANALSDVWRLNVSGILSSNMPDSVQGSWEHLALANLPGLVGQSGAVISQQIIAAGGCDSTALPTVTNTTCAKQDSFIIDTSSLSEVSPGSCPAPRVSPVLVPNMNAFSTSFASQVFLLLGVFNSSQWQDSGGLAQGEVAILDINTGSWTRVLPAGDPDSSGTAHFPSARAGAAGFSFSEALVGNSRNTSSDTIIFGGQDSEGNILSEIWLLRAYTGVITPSSPTWAGFGDGQLQTGINADGSGVRANYLTQCTSFISQPGSNAPSSNNVSIPNSGPGDSGQSTPSQNQHLFNTAFVHKLFTPLSLGVLLPVLLFFRWSQSSIAERWIPNRNVILVTTFTIFGLAAYGVGVVGFVLSFTTITSQSGTTQNTHLKTTHGIAGLVFFVCLYVLIPFLYLVFACFAQLSGIYGDVQSRTSDDLGHSIDTNEKIDPGPAVPQSVTPSAHNTSPPSSPRPRTLSWDASNMLRPSRDGGMSGESASSATVSKGFEVVDRSNRVRRLSAPWPGTGPSVVSQSIPTSRSLGDIDWLLRRRSLNAVGELDYAITQAHKAQYASDPETPTSLPVYIPMVEYPRPLVMVFHVLIQVSVTGLSAVSLAELWTRAPRYLFAIFLVWLAAYYAIMTTLAWRHRPASSLLTAVLSRFRGKTLPPIPLESPGSPPAAVQGPYTYHRPPYRAVTHPDELSYSHITPLSVETDDNDDDVDEDTRQRLIEEEMERREVSIVTVPRRKLLIANPS